ncbi:glycosyltransferase family 2 protein [Mesoterricola sediminis]|uniref:Glycosyltransferase 2-like domain-containing protein n=1 Tax=Mesoterricola sediminis TaxID=2927980 RepID=A0AA48GPL2_9BACT|nr:glycosyltransferase family 2 protein [Mesoterricola sediminis]BDU75219.1 hypothetical protein METESE_01770 [Mesoterricola sediminis]
MKLTVAMIARDEAAHLGHCLASIQDLADEIVLVDTGSVDGTPAIAAAHGARVGTFAWVQDFAAARNASLDLATGDWVLVLDADEAVDAADHGRIRAALAAPGAEAYRVLIRNYLPGGAFTMMDTEAKANPGGYREGAAHARCADTRGVRLFRRRPWARFTSRVHEMVDPAFLARGIQPRDLDAVIHHYGFTLADRVRAKKPVYLELARRDAEDRPGDAQAQFHLLIQAATAEAWELAVQAADRFLALTPGAAPGTVLLTRAVALQRLGRHAEAEAAFRTHLARHPDSAPGVAGRAVSLERLGRGAEARALLEACVQAHPAFATPWLDLADLHARAGDPVAARAVLERALAGAPGDPDLRARLVRLGLETGDPNQAVLDAWEALRACPRGGEGTWHLLVGVQLLRQGARAEARQILEQGLAAFPGHPDLLRVKEMA